MSIRLRHSACSILRKLRLVRLTFATSNWGKSSHQHLQLHTPLSNRQSQLPPFGFPSSTNSTSIRPCCNKCLYLSRKTSPFKQLQTTSNNKKLPETSSRTPQTASTLPHPNRNNFAKEEVKTIYTTTACSSHNLLMTPKLIYASALHTCQLDLCAETPTLRSLSIRQVVVKKEKRKTKTKLNRQPCRLLVLAISACMHIHACMYSHGSLSI
jgi:hypothetical protein